MTLVFNVRPLHATRKAKPYDSAGMFLLVAVWRTDDADLQRLTAPSQGFVLHVSSCCEICHLAEGAHGLYNFRAW